MWILTLRKPHGTTYMLSLLEMYKDLIISFDLTC